MTEVISQWMGYAEVRSALSHMPEGGTRIVNGRTVKRVGWRLFRLEGWDGTLAMFDACAELADQRRRTV